MTRSRNSKPNSTKEYWTSRGGKRHGEAPGSVAKRKTHRRERRLGKTEEKEEP